MHTVPPPIVATPAGPRLPPVKLTTALLCDYAQVRDGLVHIVAGGVNRLVRRAFPAPMGVSFAIVMEFDQFERQRDHELTIRIIDADGHQIAQGSGAVRPRRPQPPGPMRSQVPHVFDLRGVKIPGEGAYELKVYIDGAHHSDVPFEAMRAAEPSSPDATQGE